MPTNKHLTGLQKLCKAYGRMKVGNTMMVWDYANDAAVPKSEMPDGSKRWAESERVKFGGLAKKAVSEPQP